jgi:hypothetical protein
VIHIENDNTIYFNVNDLTLKIADARQEATCSVHLAYPVVDYGRVAVSIMYIYQAQDLEKLLQFNIACFKMGREAVQNYLRTNYVNDMSISFRYLLDKRLSDDHEGVAALPAHFLRPWENNCLLKATGYLFDGATLGQYFGGVHSDPNRREHWDNDRIMDPRGKTLVWKDGLNGYKIPHIDSYPVANLHIHSKQLQRFFSSENWTKDV